MVCDKAVCERWCGERWCVTKLCVKDGVSKMVGDKVVCDKVVPATRAARATRAASSVPTQNEGRCLPVPRLPRETKVDVAKCHACHAKCRSITGDQSQPKRAISATPATQNEGRCLQVPRLPRETKVDVAKCHACHAKCRGVTGDQVPRRHRRPTKPKRATRASQVP